jgi:hypothetical protein
MSPLEVGVPDVLRDSTPQRGSEETDDGIWWIYFGTVLLGKVDERDMIIRD